MTVGVFGGTFDPPHIGHLIIAQHVLQEIGLDRIVFVPGATPPHKQDREISPATDRLAMLRAAIIGNPGFEVSEAEIERGGVSFTVDTLLHMHAARPDDGLYFLLGMDNLPEFAAWKDPDRIVDLARLVVMTRPGFSPELPSFVASKNPLLCKVPGIGVSSSMVREMVAGGRSIRYLVPDAVARHIAGRRLYR
jgi:nicotinate-nucleotide adenylyltransferase